MSIDLEKIGADVKSVCEELIETAGLEAGGVIVVGCSTSEICGEAIGQGSSYDAAKAVLAGLKIAAGAKNIGLAIQCCEHLNRAIVLEKKTLAVMTEKSISCGTVPAPGGFPIRVNAVPQEHAGGSLATAFYRNAEEPVLIEGIYADAGIDIGDTLIGMHLKRVAVPVRTKIGKIGEANVVCARTRVPYTGGERAKYDDALSKGDIKR